MEYLVPSNLALLTLIFPPVTCPFLIDLLCIGNIPYLLLYFSVSGDGSVQTFMTSSLALLLLAGFNHQGIKQEFREMERRE